MRDLTDRSATAADDHYGAWDAVAAGINNGGHSAQIRFLLDQLGAEATEQTLREATR